MSTQLLSPQDSSPRLPGPNAKRVLAGDSNTFRLLITSLLPTGCQTRARHRGHRRRWKRILRFLRGHRCHLDRPLPSGRGRRDSKASGGTDPHVRHRFPITKTWSRWRSACRRSSHARAAQNLLRQLRRGSHRVRPQLARYHTKRQNVIAFYGAFHGRTMGALSLTASKPQQKRRFGPWFPA